jgi:hypothetical protein
MAILVFMSLVVALILIGVGIVIGLVACCIAAVLFAIGVLSSSVMVGILSRRPSAGFRAFLLQCAVISGIPAGIACAWLGHYIYSAAGQGWLISLYGGLGGAIAGLVIALFLEFIFRRLHRWAAAKFGRASSELAVPSI